MVITHRVYGFVRELPIQIMRHIILFLFGWMPVRNEDFAVGCHDYIRRHLKAESCCMGEALSRETLKLLAMEGYRRSQRKDMSVNFRRFFNELDRICGAIKEYENSGEINDRRIKQIVCWHEM